MKKKGKVLPIIGLVAFIISIVFLSIYYATDNADYSLLAVLSGFVFLICLIITFIKNKSTKKETNDVQYGRFDDKAK